MTGPGINQYSFDRPLFWSQKNCFSLVWGKIIRDFFCSSLLKVRICCFSLSFVAVNDKSLGF